MHTHSYTTTHMCIWRCSHFTTDLLLSCRTSFGPCGCHLFNRCMNMPSLPFACSKLKSLN
jgi:hypothetical protein